VYDPSLPLKWGVPPPVSPPYMTFCQVRRGFNPINKVFVKNFWENFSKKSGLYIPHLMWVGFISFPRLSLIISYGKLFYFLGIFILI
jgi:hypothetical protein